MTPLALLLFAAVPNPDPPLPSTDPVTVGWFSYTNDSFIGKTADDYRTAAFSSGCTLGGAEWLSADYQIGTDTHKDQRADELAVAGWYRSDWWSVGLGARVSEDFGGQSLQNQWHRISGDKPIVCTYESRALEPIGLLKLQWSRYWDHWKQWEHGRPTALRVDGECTVEGSSHGVRSETKFRVNFGQYPTAVSAGTVLWLDRVTPLSGTAASIERNRGVAAFEIGVVTSHGSLSLILTNTNASWLSLTVRY